MKRFLLIQLILLLQFCRPYSMPTTKPSVPSEEESDWILLQNPPATQKSSSLKHSEQVDDLLEFRPRPSPTPVPQIQPRQDKNKLDRGHGRYLFNGPTDEIVSFYRQKQVQTLKRLLFMVVVDGGSSKTAGSLWKTMIISEMNKVPVADWETMTEQNSLAKEERLGTFIDAVKNETLEVLAPKVAKVFRPILLRARQVITELLQNLDPDKVVSDIPIFVHSTAGLRDIEVEGRNKLFAAIAMVVNGKVEREDLDNSSPSLGEEGVALTRFEVKDKKTNKVIKVMRFFTTPKYCRSITGENKTDIQSKCKTHSLCVSTLFDAYFNGSVTSMFSNSLFL